jgi:formylglycine-generating enzyme required for sulfatase activity
MPLNHGPPDEGFMRELREVARDAIALSEPLTKPLNFGLPPDFPKDQLVDICRSLAQLPHGTAEGSRPALEYARNRLPAIRRVHVLSEELDTSKGDVPPPVLRGALIDLRLRDLIASVTTALDEYRRLAAEEPAEEPKPEAAVTPSGDVTDDAVAKSARLEAKLAEAKATVEETTNPNSRRADDLKREINDAVSLNRLARVELQMKKIFVTLYRRTVNALKDYPKLIRTAAARLRDDTDIVQMGFERWHDFKRNSTIHLFEEIKKTLDTLEAVGVRLEQRRTKADEDRMRAEGRVKILIYPPAREQVRWIRPRGGRNNADVFQDIEGGPEMVVVPAGKFMMGSPEDEPERDESEGPQREVTFAQPFAVGRHAVTRGQFAAFVNATSYEAGNEWRNPGFKQDGSHPVVCVSWDDAKAYASWLAEATGRPYRLLTEAEWEYAARAGTTTPFWWGSSITPAQANYNGNYVYEGGGSKGEYREGTVPVRSFEPNPWGLYNVHGNVWEWCEDLWHGSYKGASSDGSAWLPKRASRGRSDQSSSRVVRGGAWNYYPGDLRSAQRYWYLTVNRNGVLGFRLGRTLTS